MDTRIDAGLLMPQTDLFDIFTKHRKKLLTYLEANPKVCNEVMESVVRVVTLTGNRTKAKKANLLNREWKSMLGYMCRGRFAPDTDASGNGAAGNGVAGNGQSRWLILSHSHRGLPTLRPAAAEAAETGGLLI